MNNPVPPATLDAVMDAIAKTQYCSDWGAGKLAEIALEAAGFGDLLAALEMLCPLTHTATCESNNWIKMAKEEHCTCGATLARSALAKAKGESTQ